MNKNKLFLVMISFSFWLSSSLYAQNYPNRAVKLIVTNPAGGSSDIMARTIAQKLSELWKQSVIVENKAGGGGTIGMVYAANQPADGCTAGCLRPLRRTAVNGGWLQQEGAEDNSCTTVTG